MIAIKDIYWVAGLLEGEGCFYDPSRAGHNPTIQLIMTDKDVVIRVAKILGAYKVIECNKPTKSGKPLYRMVLYGRQVLCWMLTLYSLMGERRKAKIKEIVSMWTTKLDRNYPERRSYSRGAKIVWERGVCHRR